MSGKCSKACIVSPFYDIALEKNVATLELDDNKNPVMCVTCEMPAKIVCVGCYCVVYCSRKCLLVDYERHQHECELHSSRLWLFRNLELYSAQSVRIKHTGDEVMGVGMCARQAMFPGDRVIEDYIHYTAEMIEQVITSGDFTGYEELEMYIKAIYNNIGEVASTKFALHSGQMMAMTQGYQGFWTLFINHSCTPNAIIRPSRCRRFLLVTAIRPIAVGEEITISYSGVAYSPMSIRTPLLQQLLGCPCNCPSCLNVDPEDEIQRLIVWDMIQHWRHVEKSHLLSINHTMTGSLAITIANRIIVSSRKLLGPHYPYADPWLAVVEHTVCEFVRQVSGIIKTSSLRHFLNLLQDRTTHTKKCVGVCVRACEH